MNDQKDLEEWECYVCLDEHIHTPPVIKCTQCNRGTICKNCTQIILEFNYLNCGLCNKPFKKNIHFNLIRVLYFCICPIIYYCILGVISIYTLQCIELNFIQSLEMSLLFYSIYCIVFLFFNIIFMQFITYQFDFTNMKLLIFSQNIHYMINIIVSLIISLYSKQEDKFNYFKLLFITLFISDFIFFYFVYILLYCYHQRLQYI